MPITVLDLEVRAKADVKGAQRGLEALGTSGDKAVGKFEVSVQKVSPIAERAFVQAGAATGAFVASGIEAFGAFDQGMREVFTLMPGISADAMGSMEDQVLDLSREIGVMPDKVIPALYSAISAGVPPDNVFDFLRTANQAAVGGVTDLETAVDGISSVTNAYGSDVISAAEASDQMFTAVKLGKTTMDELSASLFQVVPTASALGVEFGDVTAALATMTSQGTPTSVATTQLRQLFVELSKAGGKAAATFEEIAGKSFQEFIAEGGNVADALEIMQQGAADQGVALQDMFGSVEAGAAALQLTGSGAEKFGAALDEMGGSAGATEDAFDTMEDGVTTTGRKIAATFGTLGIQAGKFFEPIAPAVLSLNALAPALGGLVTPAKLLGGVFGAAGGKIASLLTGGLVKAFGGITAALGPAVAGVVSGIGGLFAAAMPILVAALPFLLIAAVVAAIAVLILNEEIRDAVFGFIGGILEWIGDALRGLGELLSGIFSAAFELVGGIIGAAVDVILAPIRALVDFVSGMFEPMIGPATEAWELVSGVVGTYVEIITFPIRFLIDLVLGMFGGAPEAAGAAWDAISGIVGTAIEIITAPVRFLIDLVGGMFSAAPKAAGAAWAAITGVVRGAIGIIGGVIRSLIGIAQGVWNTVSGIFGAIGDAARAAADAVGSVVGGAGDVAGGVFDFLNPFQSGAWEIPRDMPAFIHKGEMILPPDLAESFRRFVTGPGTAAAGSGPRTAGASPPVEAGGGSMTVQNYYTVELSGILPARSVRDVGRGLRMLGEAGTLTRSVERRAERFENA